MSLSQLPSELISNVISYGVKYPQKYATVSKSLNQYIDSSQGDLLSKQYPRYDRTIEHTKYSLNKAALLNEWEDFILILNNSIKNGNFTEASLDGIIKYAIAVCHRFGKNMLKIELFKKFNIKPDIQRIRNFTIHYVYGQSKRYNRVLTVDLIMLDTYISLSKNIESDKLFTEFNKFLNEFGNRENFGSMLRNSGFPIYIGNLSKKSLLLLEIINDEDEDEDIDNVMVNGVNIPLSTRLDVFSYLSVNEAFNDSLFEKCWDIPIATRTLVNRVQNTTYFDGMMYDPDTNLVFLDLEIEKLGSGKLAKSIYYEFMYRKGKITREELESRLPVYK